MRVKITNNIYIVQIFYDFEKEKKKIPIFVGFFKKKPNNCCTSFTSFSVFTLVHILLKIFQKDCETLHIYLLKQKCELPRMHVIMTCAFVTACVPAFSPFRQIFSFADTSHFFFFFFLIFLLQSECVYATKFVSVVNGHHGRHFSYYLFPSIRLLLSL